MIALRSKPACFGIFATGSLGGVGGRSVGVVSAPDEGVFSGSEDPSLGGRSSSSSTVAGTADATALPIGRLLANVAVEGGRTTCDLGPSLIFLRPNQPPLFCSSSSVTTTRSSVKSGSLEQFRIQ